MLTTCAQILQLLGAVIPRFSGNNVMHLDEDGNFLDHNDVSPDEIDSEPEGGLMGYDKEVRKVKTPKLLQMAREQYKCDKIDGIPLEDVSLGLNAHWESRLLGSEFLSYGSSSGEVYVSDLTLAYLEDTSMYFLFSWLIVNLISCTVLFYTTNSPVVQINILLTTLWEGLSVLLLMTSPMWIPMIWTQV